jgi:hypothetical protein
MEWEEKTQMVQLGNCQHQDENSKIAFQDFVTANVERFDAQAWDMFVNLTDLDVVQMRSDIEHWSKLYKHIKYWDTKDDKVALRTAVRLAAMQTICEEELGLTE